MLRNGLIKIIILGSLLLFAQTLFCATPDQLSDEKFKHFQEGIRLIKAEHFDEAYDQFKKASSDDFILADYAYLFMGIIKHKQEKFRSAIKYLAKIDKFNQPHTITFSKNILGEIYFKQEKYKEAFESIFTFYKRTGIDRENSKSFINLSGSFLNMDNSDKIENDYIPYMFSFLKINTDANSLTEKFPLLADIIVARKKTFRLSSLWESPSFRSKTFNRIRRNLYWEGDLIFSRLNWMKNVAQRMKDYPLKIKVLNQLLKLSRNNIETARTEFAIANAYLNNNQNEKSLDYFARAAKHSGRSFLKYKSYYYSGRVYELTGQLTNAARNYRKLKKARYRTPDEKDFIIKSIFRAGWVNYKAKNYKRAYLDFKYIYERFGNRLTHMGYPYWYGMILLKTGNKETAKNVFESFYREYPTSYYGLLCAIQLKKVFSYDVPLEEFSVLDFVNEVSGKTRRLVNRSLLLFISGLKDFAVKEAQMIRPNYGNTKEMYIVASLNMLLNRYIQTISLVDSLINQQTGIPDKEILKIFFPRKYMHFIEEYSKMSQIDPYMVISIIRQESVFQEGAVSRANALGLMQIMPHVGNKVAESLDMGTLTRDELLEPQTNLKLGITHLAELYKKFKGNFILTAAAYNSSEEKVKEWRKRFPSKNIYQFIEDIPYYETRKYVKMNVRNYFNYLRTYTDRDWQSALP